MFQYKDIPDEVLWASVIISTSHGIGADTYEKIEEIIAKYPEYFPWETKYNSIPKEVHQAYIKEKYPDRDKPIVCTSDGEGLYSKIKNEPFVYKQLTSDEILQYFKDWDKLLGSDLEMKREAKELWDKHYKKYNLKYRE